MPISALPPCISTELRQATVRKPPSNSPWQEDELSQRTMELLSENADKVVQLLVNYAQSSGAHAAHALRYRQS